MHTGQSTCEPSTDHVSLNTNLLRTRVHVDAAFLTPGAELAKTLEPTAV